MSFCSTCRWKPLGQRLCQEEDLVTNLRLHRSPQISPGLRMSCNWKTFECSASWWSNYGWRSQICTLACNSGHHMTLIAPCFRSLLEQSISSCSFELAMWSCPCLELRTPLVGPKWFHGPFLAQRLCSRCHLSNSMKRPKHTRATALW